MTHHERDRSAPRPGVRRSIGSLVDPEQLVGPDWAAWYALTPMQRLGRSMEMWTEYVALGGSLDPEVDTQSPFWSDEDFEEFARRQVTRRLSVDQPDQRVSTDDRDGTGA